MSDASHKTTEQDLGSAATQRGRAEDTPLPSEQEGASGRQGAPYARGAQEEHTPLSRLFGTATPSRRGDDWRLTILFALVCIAVIAALTWCVIGWREAQHLVAVTGAIKAAGVAS